MRRTHLAPKGNSRHMTGCRVSAQTEFKDLLQRADMLDLLKKRSSIRQSARKCQFTDPFVCTNFILGNTEVAHYNFEVLLSTQTQNGTWLVINKDVSKSSLQHTYAVIHCSTFSSLSLPAFYLAKVWFEHLLIFFICICKIYFS